MSSCITLAESLEMFNIVKLTLFFLLITQANCFRIPFRDFNPFGGIGTVLWAWFHRIWNPSYEIDADSRTTVRYINGTTVLTAKIGEQKYTATFPRLEIVETDTYYLVDAKGTQTQIKITFNGNQTYIYKTKNGRTTVTDGKKRPVRDDPFHINTNNIVSTTNEPTPGRLVA